MGVRPGGKIGGLGCGGPPPIHSDSKRDFHPCTRVCKRAMGGEYGGGGVVG